MFFAHRGPQLDLRPVGSFARPPPAPRRHSKQPDEEQEDDELCVVIYDLEDGEVGAEDEAEMAEAGGGEVEETEGIREIVVQNLPIPEPMRGPRKRRRPPREEWIVNQDLYRQQDGGGAQANANGDQSPPRGRRRTRPPDFLGIEKGREQEEIFNHRVSREEKLDEKIWG